MLAGSTSEEVDVLTAGRWRRGSYGAIMAPCLASRSRTFPSRRIPCSVVERPLPTSHSRSTYWPV